VEINAILPFVSAAVMVVFVFFVFRRFFQKKMKAWHLGLWGLGLTFYLLGSLMEATHAALGWNAIVFRLWYLFGAVLVAAWLGQGTVELLVRRRIKGVRVSHILLVILAAGSIYATFKVFTAKLEPIMLSETVTTIETTGDYTETEVLGAAAGALKAPALTDEGEVSSRVDPLTSTILAEANRNNIAVEVATDYTVSQMPGVNAVVNNQNVSLSVAEDSLQVNIDGQAAGIISTEIGREMHGHAIVTGGTRVLTPFFNMYGLFTLVGGAIYSAYIFLRKRIMPNRVIGNVLIAAGALMPGIGGLLSRFGMGGYLYVGELVGAVLMFMGFIAATRKPQAVKQPQAQMAQAGSDR